MTTLNDAYIKGQRKSTTQNLRAALANPSLSLEKFLLPLREALNIEDRICTGSYCATNGDAMPAGCLVTAAAFQTAKFQRMFQKGQYTEINKLVNQDSVPLWRAVGVPGKQIAESSGKKYAAISALITAFDSWGNSELGRTKHLSVKDENGRMVGKFLTGSARNQLKRMVDAAIASRERELVAA